MSNEAVQDQAVCDEVLQDEAEPVAGPTEQLAFDPLPSMNDLDALQIDLDQVDRVLADLDNKGPVGVTPNPSQ